MVTTNRRQRYMARTVIMTTSLAARPLIHFDPAGVLHALFTPDHRASSYTICPMAGVTYTSSILSRMMQCASLRKLPTRFGLTWRILHLQNFYISIAQTGVLIRLQWDLSVCGRMTCLMKNTPSCVDHVWAGDSYSQATGVTRCIAVTCMLRSCRVSMRRLHVPALQASASNNKKIMGFNFSQSPSARARWRKRTRTWWRV